VSVTPTDPALDLLADNAVETVRMLLVESEKLRRHDERTNRKRFTRLFKDPNAIDVTITLTDEVMRINSVRSSANIFRQAAAKSSAEGFGLLNDTGMKVLATLSRAAPAPVIRLVGERIRRLSRDLILPAEPVELRKRIERRARDGIAMNINVLGEAVLGEREADERLERVIEMIRRPEVNYISVKLSAVVSQIITADREGSVARVSEKLRQLYREADRHETFINLDMEEFRDLELTVATFKSVLEETEFEEINAGIVLQAYLPESHESFAELARWSLIRHGRTGASIKVRLVKGANLAMETAEAELHGWPAAPYRTKADVDASYARLLDVALRPEFAAAVRIGVASHNLFHLSWALDVARSRGVREQVDIEMLEGMANAESLAIARTGQKVLLYAPVTRRDDFASAVAYLVRRLDENTSDENYLKAAFDIGSDGAKFDEQRERFLRSVRERHQLSYASLRHTRASEMVGTPFHNVANFDPTSPGASDLLLKAFNDIRKREGLRIPLVIGGEDIDTGSVETGNDPSAEGAPWYEYCVADRSHIDRAFSVSKDALPAWTALGVDGRRARLLGAADVMEKERLLTVAVMARDAGKTEAEADPEVSEGVDFARFYANSAGAFEDSSALGTVVVVPPWNFPYAIPAGGVCAALAAGNTVILKPAPETVATAWHLACQLWDGGVPRDVLQFVPTRDDESGQYLVTNPDVNGLVLTGSFDTALMFTRWRPEINLLAETSGKNAILVSACADIDVAVRDIVQSAFGHAGQKCSAASLAIVVRDVYDDPAFLRQLGDAVRTLRVGPGWELSTFVGPIIRRAEPALERALSRLDPGERWLVEPRQLDASGLLWSPGVKLGVRTGSWSHQHEWFGPVLGVMVAPDLETAIDLQNRTDFGLTAGLQSLDESECEIWMDRVQAGNLYINRGTTGAVVQRQPFGGWRRSSVGPTAKTGGDHYVRALRQWTPLTDATTSIASAQAWWLEVGSRAVDQSGLRVERNYQRYRRHAKAIAVRIDDSVNEAHATFLKFLANEIGITFVVSSPSVNAHFENATIELVSSLVARAPSFSRVRWLTMESAPTVQFLERGITVDRRPLAQRGDVETPRWLLEQSVAITHHRYGNVNGGPKPNCPGLGDET
jgi:RHH-type proline utilization regulon transcriptional repressor/proline dehydrogenase/delta 1-pyrroline-5-carboxylate dehydrogenase